MSVGGSFYNITQYYQYYSIFNKKFKYYHNTTQYYKVSHVQIVLPSSKPNILLTFLLGTAPFLGKTSEKTEHAFFESEKIVKAFCASPNVNR